MVIIERQSFLYMEVWQMCVTLNTVKPISHCHSFMKHSTDKEFNAFRTVVEND